MKEWNMPERFLPLDSITGSDILHEIKKLFEVFTQSTKIAEKSSATVNSVKYSNCKSLSITLIKCKEVFMKVRNYLSMVAIAGLLVTACSSPVYVQKDDTVDLSSYHTYMWVDTRANENDNSARAMAYADISVRNAVNQQFSKVGWREVNENADVLVSYDVLVERSTQQQSDPVYSQPMTRTYYNPYSRRWRTIYYPSQFVGYQNYEVPVKEGTVTVSMVDAQTDKLVWQGWTTENMNYSRLTDDEIDRSVRHIFNKFDVSSR